LIFRQTDSLVLCLLLWLMEFLIESASFLQCIKGKVDIHGLIIVKISFLLFLQIF
jgi:hypothetical protein